MDFPAYEIWNPQHEFTKGTYILETVPPKENIYAVSCENSIPN